MEFKGTKGIWQTDVKTNLIMCDKGYVVASISSSGNAIEDESNKKLIAASPELLEALIDLVNANAMLDGYHEKKLKAIEAINKALK